MRKTIGIIALIFTLSFNLQAKDNSHMDHQKMRKHQEFFENLTPKQREEVMELRAEFMHKEFHLNREIRSLRMKLNSCMTEEEIDIDKYQELRKRAQELKEERRQFRMEYRKQILDVIENSSNIEEYP